MSRIRIFVRPEDISDTLQLKDKDTIHKMRNVLRLKKMDEIIIFDGAGKEYNAEIVSLSKHFAQIRKKTLLRKTDFTLPAIILAFPSMREEKVNLILQKATELGVTNLIPYLSSRSLNFELTPAKYKRWQAIIIEATRQSERLWLPALSQPLEFDEILRYPADKKIAASLRGGQPEQYISALDRNLLLLVGPEGDFSPSEYYRLKENNFSFVRISPNTLRSETAAIFLVGLFRYLLDTK